MTSRWQEIECDGHVCQVFEPSRTDEHRRAVIYLHEYDQQSLRDHPEFEEQFERWGLHVVAPQAGPTWWTDRICPVFDDRYSAEHYVREVISCWIKDRWEIRPKTIGLLGTGMGGQGALRMSYRCPRQFPVVAAISPAIDYQLRFTEGDPVICQLYSDPEAVRQDTATLHIHPLNWPRHQFLCCDPSDDRWLEGCDRLQMKLHSLGIPHQHDLETTGGGHTFAYYDRMAARAVEFLAQGLESERLRLPTSS